MSHGIEKTDLMLSTEGYSWHRLDRLVQQIDEETATPLFFDVIESPLMVNIDNQLVNMAGYKSLVADHRAVRPDLAPQDQLIPLHIPKDGYKVIKNKVIMLVIFPFTPLIASWAAWNMSLFLMTLYPSFGM